MEKRLGFLTFGHWRPDALPVGNRSLRHAVSGSQVRTARDAVVQTVELAVAAEELGVDGASVRVHHFAPQLAPPFPLLAAIAARTRRIEIGTCVIDMRYENRCTWPRRRRRPTCSPAAGCSWGSAADRRRRR